MATAPALNLMTMDEYLHTSWHPDCDFVDGVVEERNMGETKHSLLQAELTIWFGTRRKEWKIRVMPELRTRVGETRVRIPDVTVAYDDAAIAEQVRRTPALIAIEVLSPEDYLPRVIKRLADFWEMGIRNVWLLDPIDRTAFVYLDGGLKQVEGRLTVAHSPVYVDLSELFSALD